MVGASDLLPTSGGGSTDNGMALLGMAFTVIAQGWSSVRSVRRLTFTLGSPGLVRLDEEERT